ncbi:MAG: zinc ribbon domain-containing protein [Bacteroidetes bacterium]|nr:zinc ribbon domain-containing protein [Bacteroidota bacterium]
MPTYVYRREDGTKFEIKQRITDDPLDECPETGQPVERIIAGSAGLIFKGDGFYVTDHKDNGSGKEGGSAGASGDAPAAAETSSDASSASSSASSSDAGNSSSSGADTSESGS